MEFRDFLERFFEPQFDDNQFVTHYQPALDYKYNTKASYAFTIREETYLPTQIISNIYRQDISISFKNKSNDKYQFDLNTTNQEFILDESLASQRPILEDLSALTKDISLVVDSSGNIIGFNHEELLKQWKPLKKKLLGRYKGELSNAYIGSIDKRVQQEELFLKELKQAKLFGLFFNSYQQAHQKDAPRIQKESMMLHCLSAHFTEKIDTVSETEQSKTICYKGSFKPYDESTQCRIKEYFNYYGITSSDLYLSNYRKEVTLNTQTGFPKNIQYSIELTNGGGYIRRKHYELKQQDNG